LTENGLSKNPSSSDQAEEENNTGGDQETGLPSVEKAEDELAEPPEPPRIGLYSGRGSWETDVSAFSNYFEQYGYPYSHFDETDAAEMDLAAQYDLICFPGGFAAEYKNYIKNHDNIRSFIAEGGLFMGVCAGAYYACDILKWQGTDNPYPLGLFDGKGVGPLSGLVGWGETTVINLNREYPVNNSFDQGLEMYYFDGPYFEPYAGKEVDVLASYDVNGEPAIIAGSFGEGAYLLFGPHPELGGYSPSSPEFNLEGGEGAQWPWLHSVLTWFSGR